MNGLCCLAVIFIILTISIRVGESHENIMRWIIEAKERDE